MFIHLTLVPFIGHAGELKTKPTQHSVNELRRIGIQPDMVVCRSEGALSRDIRQKIALFASLPEDAVVSARDVDNIYKVPLVFRAEGVDDFVLDHFGIEADRARPGRAGRRSCSRADEATRTVRIALVGKYVKLEDAYLSVDRGAAPRRASPRLPRSRSTGSTPRRSTSPRRAPALEDADGILIPGGFGVPRDRGQDRGGARRARAWRSRSSASASGMQMAVAEFARHVAGMDGANSTEFDPETPYPVIDLLPEQKEVARHGRHDAPGRRPDQAPRRHARARDLRRGGHLRAPPPPLRGQQLPALAARARRASCVSGTSPDERLVEVIELPDHPFFVASQYHPEFKSRPERPAPLFREFVGAALERARSAGDSDAEPVVQRGRRGRAVRVTSERCGRASEAERAPPERHVRRAVPRSRARSGASARCADAVTAELRALGLEVEEDDAAGPRPGPSAATSTPASRDRPARRTRAALRAPRHRAARRARSRSERGRRTAGRTRNAAILGADNKAAMAVMLEAVRRACGRGQPGGHRAALHRLRGERAARGQGVRRSAAASAVRLRLRPRHADRRGDRSPRRPTTGVAAEFHGAAAHAGIRPEDGRSAIAAAAAAVAAMRLGRLDDGDDRQRRRASTAAARRRPTSCPTRCRVEAEARRLDARARVEEVVASMVDARPRRGQRHRVRRRRRSVERAVPAATARARTARPSRPPSARCARRGYEPRRIVTGGGSDANALDGQRLPCVNLANGTERNHEPTERVSVAALEAMLDVTLRPARRGRRVGPMLELRRGVVVEAEPAGDRCSAWRSTSTASAGPPSRTSRWSGRRRPATRSSSTSRRVDLGLGSAASTSCTSTSRAAWPARATAGAHVMKLNYTRLQHAVAAGRGASELAARARAPGRSRSSACTASSRRSRGRRPGAARGRARLRPDRGRRAPGRPLATSSPNCASAGCSPAT